MDDQKVLSRSTVRFHENVISRASVRPTLAVAKVLYFHFRTLAGLSNLNTYPIGHKSNNSLEETLEYFKGTTLPKWFMHATFSADNLMVASAVFYKEGTDPDKAQYKIEILKTVGRDCYYQIIKTKTGEIESTFGIEYK